MGRAKFLVVAALWLTLGLGAGCSGGSSGPLGSKEHPVVLLLSHAHTVNASPVDLTTLEGMLERSTGLDVELKSAATGAEALSALGRHEAHLGLLTLFEYLLAHKEYNVQARLRVIRAVNRDPRSYTGEILVRTDGPTTLEALRGKDVAFVDPYSVSGYLLPMALLAKQGISVEAHFTGSHRAALDALREGKVVAAAVYAGLSEHDAAFRVLATTDRIPNEPVFVAPGTDPAVAQKVLDALQQVASSREGRQVLHHLAHISGFEPVDDSAYLEAFQVVSGAGKFIQDLVPGAREMSWANQAGWPL